MREQRQESEFELSEAFDVKMRVKQKKLKWLWFISKSPLTTIHHTVDASIMLFHFYIINSFNVPSYSS